MAPRLLKHGTPLAQYIAPRMHGEATGFQKQMRGVPHTCVSTSSIYPSIDETLKIIFYHFAITKNCKTTTRLLDLSFSIHLNHYLKHNSHDTVPLRPR